MCPWKHIEMLATWKCSKMATEWILNAAVQITAVWIKLTAARQRSCSYVNLWSFSTTCSLLLLVPYHALCLSGLTRTQATQLISRSGEKIISNRHR